MRHDKMSGDGHGIEASKTAQVRVLILEAGHDSSTNLYRLEQGWTLSFQLGASLMGCTGVTLWTNYPASSYHCFKRSAYQQIDMDSETPGGCGKSADLLLSLSGAFHFYLTFNTRGSGDTARTTGYFLVDPSLQLPLDSIQCQSVLTKCLGPINTWEKRLKVAKETGYNMVHFTPLQELGGSNSAYCLSDHLSLDGRYEATWDEVGRVIGRMRDDWGVLSICDIVLNHAANESKWLKDHPEATYNLANCPHLRPAFILDQMLARVSLDIQNGKWVKEGVPKGLLSSPNHVIALRQILLTHYIPPLKIHEFFMTDIDREVEKFMAYKGPVKDSVDEEIKLILDPARQRFGSVVDLSVAHSVCTGSDINRFRTVLFNLNVAKEAEVSSKIQAAVDNVLRGARYERLDPSGPRLTKCGADTPLTTPYFTNPVSSEELEELSMEAFIKSVEDIAFDTRSGALCMAHNGWVMGLDPTTDFASPLSEVYLRRELIAWGDSVKLNYGDRPEDSPFLWDHMKSYVTQTAEIFDGVRLDNCHSTPLHVAEYLLDAARQVKKDLYVVAELFTGSEATDNRFLNRLGITALIREALSAWDSHEHGRLVHRFGGDPVGAFSQPSHRPLTPSMARAIFFDQTHDNPSPLEKRGNVKEVLSNAALTTMSACAVGSNRGFDELVPHHIHVVNEDRFYQEWDVASGRGITEAKKVFNDLHRWMSNEGFSELFVDQMSEDVVAVTRHCPSDHRSVVTVVSTAFHPGVAYNHPLELRVEGQLVKVIYEAALRTLPDHQTTNFEKNETVINGLVNHEAYVKTNFSLEKSELSRLKHADDGATLIELHDLQPGSAISFLFKLPEKQDEACRRLRETIQTNGPTELPRICSKLNFDDLNRVLFRCDQEEREDGKGGVYVLDGFTPAYAGLQGFMTLLAEIRPKNDLGNWLPRNLRDGDWLMDYIVARLSRSQCSEPCREMAAWLDGAFDLIKQIPTYMKPKYFDILYTMTYSAVIQRTWDLMSPFIRNGSTFVKCLALGSIQHGARVASSPLPPVSPNLLDAPPRSDPNLPGLTCAAGLPHFSTGYMRNWGRDTFISLPGLFIHTGRHSEARHIILAFAGTLRHGLIPNLLDGGWNARFNCRDAVWWWMYCIKVYAESVNLDILNDPVKRLFPSDNQNEETAESLEQPLQDVVHEALVKHYKGLKFREWRAGPSIDEHMIDAGFDNEIGVSPDTGFVFGGNSSNCGTWMDKMGSSTHAGNKGKPSTPRDGSAVELVGLSFACLQWLAQMHTRGHYLHGHVADQVSLQEWADKIKANFDLHFYVSHQSPVERHKEYINKTGIYKDTLNSQLPWTDYQLRCNFPIAMAVAPELFDPEHAWNAICIAKEKLLGLLGMATLDPDDWAYRGDYDNSNSSTDPSIAQGANYHQGPEWVWPIGFFLRAYWKFAPLKDEARADIMKILSAHFSHIQTSSWKGLPELTNSSGKFCRDSNPTQAWSFATILELLKDLDG